MKNKLTIIILIAFLTIDMLHYFIFRLNPEYPIYGEGHYESNGIAYIKWGLCLLGIIGAVLYKKKGSHYLLMLASIGMIIIFFMAGPLSYFLLMFSAVSFWVLLFIGLYLLIINGKKIIKS